MKIISNVKIYPMDGSNQTAGAMAWDQNKILALGNPTDLINSWPGAEVLDGRGMTLLPGFLDPHIHFLQGVMFRNALDVSPQATPTIDDLKNRLSKAAEGRPREQWIVGQGYDPDAFDKMKRPLAMDLDQACPDHPAVIFHYSFHECVANSKALKSAGITRYTQSPFAGEICRDNRGLPNGVLIETAMEKVHHAAQNHMIKTGRQQIIHNMINAQNEILAHGITRIGDPAVDTACYNLYEEAIASGEFKIPVVIHFCSDHHMFIPPWDVIKTPPAPSSLDGLIHGPLKIFLDGGDRAAIVLGPFQYMLTAVVTLMRCLRRMSLNPLRIATRSPGRIDKTGKVHIGTSMIPTKACINLVHKAAESGFSPAFHAIGNKAILQALEVIRSIQPHLKSPFPPRIEHGLLMTPDMIRDISDLGVTLVTQPEFLTHMTKENLPFLPGLRPLPIRSCLDAGIPVAGSSDWPVVSHNPLSGIYHAVTRETKKGETLKPEEAVSVEQAFSMYTNAAARALGCSDLAGSLEPEKLADFILLSKDPFNTSVFELKDIKVCQTWLGGKLAFESLKGTGAEPRAFTIVTGPN